MGAVRAPHAVLRTPMVKRTSVADDGLPGNVEDCAIVVVHGERVIRQCWHTNVPCMISIPTSGK